MGCKDAKRYVESGLPMDHGQDLIGSDNGFEEGDQLDTLTDEELDEMVEKACSGDGCGEVVSVKLT